MSQIPDDILKIATAIASPRHLTPRSQDFAQEIGLAIFHERQRCADLLQDPAADRIERLRSEHDAWRDAAIEQQQKLKRSEDERQRQAEVMQEVRKAALEEAAKIAERCGRNNEDDWPGETWIAEVIAKEIRALSSEPEADHEAK